MDATEPKKDFHVETLVQEHGKDISGLGEKLSKCYSQDRYEEFQDAVKKITLATIDGDGRTKIKAHSKEAAGEYNRENGWTRLTFWLPTIIAVGAIIVAFVK